MTKTILITGATDGIGLETARQLAQSGHRLLLHGRNPEKLEALGAEMPEGTRGFLADLSRLDEVVRLAEDVAASEERIDVIINNAGVYKMADPITETGQDARFVVNTLAPLLLTRRLLDRMPKTGRVISLSSAAQAPVDLDALSGTRRVGDMDAYAQSKLALVVWTQALARDHPEGPAFIAVNPGSLLATRMVREGFGVSGNDIGIGADILRRLAVSEEFEGCSGMYFDNDAGRFASPHPAAADPTRSAAVMATLERLLPT
ncbi:SDR family NAD(P)-dependent oxidoreductase [Tropicimonas aquimaris]|uniref:SDR family NAD(P)-dependent oxidoreductase n=1 Tax=Tropicimonas aquimaris TaxID=914152 RepID=A0ABW3IQ06_9RHOB